MKKIVSIVEGTLQGFVALNALACGLIMMIYPDGKPLQMPPSMLNGSPFADFFWPGLILFSVIGIGHAAAAWMSIMRRPRFALAGMVMGLGLLIWIFAQVSMIGGGHWLQNLFFAIGTAEASLAFLLAQENGAKRK